MPNQKYYINYKEVTENRPFYADKEKYHSYHEELRIAEKIRLEEEQRKKKKKL